MDFSFAEEQRDVQNLAREILSDKAAPERQLALEKAGERFDAELWSQLAGAGLLGVALAEQYGGMAFGLTELCFFVEEAGRTVAPVPVIPVLVSAALPVQRFGTQEQAQRLLPRVVNGEILLTAALTETLNEDPVNPVATVAKAEGSRFVLSGLKTNVPFAHRAERILLAARTATGVGVFLVDPKAPGVTLTKLRVTTYEPQYDVRLDNVVVEAADVISTDGAHIMQWIAERTTVALCSMMTGIADKMMRMTASYTSERHQFGVPIATFQAVGHRAANCYIDVECQRLVTQQAVSLLDSERDATTEVQIAKIWSGDCGHRVSYAAQHLHGGMGVDRDYPLWRYCLWARQVEMTLGNSAATLATLGQRIAAGNGYSE
jgi:alkylation response protein AidB-like acyl-CoA dehydrogenase